MDLPYKRYVITGASSGLGLALATRLLQLEGTVITAVARNIKPLREMPKKQVYALSLDVSQPENIETMLDTAIERMNGIDCVIACAGFGYYERFYQKDYRHIERIFQTNVLSPLYTLQLLLQKTKGKVSFTIISSALGKFGLPGMALYCATKYALDGFANAYCFEKADRLHFMTVYPIGLKTSFWGKIDTDIPLPRPLQLADNAAIAVLNGLRKEKRIIGTQPATSILWLANRFLPVFVPAYQAWSKTRFDKWCAGQYGDKP